jgi:GT2 family glycosyltransferase
MSDCSTCRHPRVAGLLSQVGGLGPDQPRVGAVVAYGRRFVGRGTHTVNTVPAVGSPAGLSPVDVACWGATLISRAVVDAGVLPDPEWFFGLEDFDFFCRVREAGFAVLVDDVAARAVAVHQTNQGRDEALRGHRPVDRDEPWRAYYHSRNSFALARRHGRPSWYAWHLVYSVRQFQRAHGWAHRSAIVHGFWDGARGRTGKNTRYVRRQGELDTSRGPEDGSSSTS